MKRIAVFISRIHSHFSKNTAHKKTRIGIFISLICLVLISIPLYSLFHCGSIRNVHAVTTIEISGNVITAKTDAAQMKISAVAANCLRVHISADGSESAQTPVTEGFTAEPLPFTADTVSDPAVISYDRIRILIGKNPCTLQITDTGGTVLLTELSPEQIQGKKLSFACPADAKVYGVSGFSAGSPSSSGMLRSGTLPVAAGSQGNCGAPFIWSDKGFALLADTVDGNFNASDGNIVLTGISKSDIDYYVIAGTPFDIIKEVTAISGKPPLFPKWSSGFMNSEWGIDQTELLSHINTYRSKNIPLDAFILDFDWKLWGEDNYGEWNWNSANFPDGASGTLMQTLNAKGVTLCGIMKPRIGVNTVQGRYALANNFFWPGKKPYADYFSGEQVNDLNFALPQCRQWFWDHLKGSYDTGIRGFWNDEQDAGFDSLQGMNMQRALYEGQRSHTTQRVWSINRNFYLGAQRYAYAMWSGDIASDFPTMKAQRERMLSAVNLGMMRWSMDTGGFNGTPSNENYARWMQFAAFCPVFRVHGTMDVQRQPWFYGDTAEKAASDAIRLRYKLIPYIYSYEKQYHDNGVYLVRPLFWENTGNADFSKLYRRLVLRRLSRRLPCGRPGRDDKKNHPA